MSYKEKYLKYKNKYLQSKNQVGGFLEEGSVITIKRNTENFDDIKNQFWISVLNFLKSNGYPELSLKDFRCSCGLDIDMEETIFDSFNNFTNSFNDAVIKAAESYDLTITIYTVTSSGKIITAAACYGNGKNIVNIAMFGQAHFELITEDGEPFVPAVIFKNELKKINEINYNIDANKMKQIYLELNEKINYLKFYKIGFKDNIEKMNQKKADIINIMENPELYRNATKQSLQIERDKYKQIKVINYLLLNQIKNLEDNISTLELIIQFYEDNLI